MFYMSRLSFFLLVLVIFSIDFSHPYIRRNVGKNNFPSKDLRKNVQSAPKTTSNLKRLGDKEQCWMRVNSKKHFEVMDKLDAEYDEVLQEYQNAVKSSDFDGQMLEVMLKKRGAAEREIHKASGDPGKIPAGLNLGGHCMMRMPDSLLFFRRMKLRNSTHFRVTHLENDLINLVLRAGISLNDIHLMGSYDRSLTDNDPSIIYYTPTYGQVEFLLKNVQYNMEGRYRLLKDRLTIELIISEIKFDDVMIIYLNNSTNQPKTLERKSIEDFLDRLKIDLDKWLKDYFNDYLMYFGVVANKTSTKFQEYDKRRAIELNDYTDKVITLAKRKLHKVKAASVTLPKFTILTVNDMKLLLEKGVLRGLDSMYRRSVATGTKDKNIRKVDAIVGFSNLKVIYQYKAWLSSNKPPLNGVMILSADELTARMGLAMVKDSESVDIQFEFLEQSKPESLTIEGTASRIISNFKYVLEQHVITIMSNTLIYNIKMLSSLTRCVPNLYGSQDDNTISNDSEETKSSVENEVVQPQTNNEASSIESTTHLSDPEQSEANTNEEKVEEDSDPNSNIDKKSDNDEPPTDTKHSEIEDKTSLEKNSQTAEEPKLISGEKNIESENTEAKDLDTDSKLSEENNQQSQIKPKKDKIFFLKDDSVELEIPSNEVQHKQKMHLKYVKNLTLSKINK